MAISITLKQFLEDHNVTYDTLEHDLKVPASRGLGREIYMRSEQVRSLPACGIEVGNHTIYHQQLSALDEEAQRAELAGAQHALSTLIGKPVTTLAYPYGGPLHFNETTCRVARELGHRCACTVMRGYNDAATDPMRLRRLNATQLSGRELAFYLLWRGVAA